MRVVRGVAVIVALLVLAPAAIAATRAIVFDEPTRVDRPGRGRVESRQTAPQVVAVRSGPLVVWEDDRDLELRYISAIRSGRRWAEVDPRLPSVATTFASDGSGTAWALADSSDGIATRSTRDGRRWTRGPTLFGGHAARHVLAAAGSDGRLLVARAALDVAHCGRVGFMSHLPTDGRHGEATGLEVTELRGAARPSEPITLLSSGRYLDADAAVAPSGGGWVASSSLHAVQLYRETGPRDWEPIVVPPIEPPASIQRVRIAPTESEVVVLLQLLRGRARETVSRSYRLSSRTWGEPRVLGSHDGTPSVDATVVPSDDARAGSTVIAAWAEDNEVRVDERVGRLWTFSSRRGGLPEGGLALATVGDEAVLAFAARRADGSTSEVEGASVTDVFVRKTSSDLHWEGAERIDRDVGKVKRPGSPRVWPSGGEGHVSFSGNGYGAGGDLLVERTANGWTDPEPIEVDGRPAGLEFVAPDGRHVVRVGDTYVFRDASKRTIRTVEDVSFDRQVVQTSDGSFVLLAQTNDPRRGEPRELSIREIGPGRDTHTPLQVSGVTDVRLYPDGGDGTWVVTKRFNRGRETIRIVARRLRDGTLSSPRTIAAAVPPDHHVSDDRAGRLLVAWVDDDGVTVERIGDDALTHSGFHPGSQLLADATEEYVAILFSDRTAKQLRVARGDGDGFRDLPALPGRFARITGLGYGYSSASSSIAGPVCFAHRRHEAAGRGMVGWDMRLHVTGDGGVTVAARHRGHFLVAQIGRDADAWSYGERGTRSKLADGDMGIDGKGGAILAWHDQGRLPGRIVASSTRVSAPSGPTTTVIVASFAAALLVGALALRRRARER